MRIAGAGIVSDPSIVFGVDVRDIRMTFLIHGNEVPGPDSVGLASCGGRSLRGRGGFRGSGTASGDVPAANRRGLLILRKNSHANQNG